MRWHELKRSIGLLLLVLLVEGGVRLTQREAPVRASHLGPQAIANLAVEKNLLKLPKLGDLRSVVLAFEKSDPQQYLVHIDELDRFIEASKCLHHEPGINPHTNEAAAKLTHIYVGEPVKTGPYWWSTPDLQKNFDFENGASIYEFGHWRTIWSVPEK